VPVSGVTPQTPDWAVDIKHLAGTIEYDACILNQAMQNLIGSSHVRIHGHSRGAAVALEAIRQWPELYSDVELVLEAPILPQGRAHPLMLALLEPLSPSMWPWIVRLLNNTPNSAYNQTFFGKMNRRKKKLLSKLFHATKDHLTIVRNIDNLLAWMARTDTSVYQLVSQGIVLIPATDRVLDRSAMLASARQAGEKFTIIETTAPSHFIILDDKKWIPELEQVASVDA
jgi:pimeloyl-ACP methyl ester carboxylesterase